MSATDRQDASQRLLSSCSGEITHAGTAFSSAEQNNSAEDDILGPIACNIGDSSGKLVRVCESYHGEGGWPGWNSTNVIWLVLPVAGTGSVSLVKGTIKPKKLRCNGVDGDSYEL